MTLCFSISFPLVLDGMSDARFISEMTTALYVLLDCASQTLKFISVCCFAVNINLYVAYGTLRNETKRNGTLRNSTLRNGTLGNGTSRNGTLRYQTTITK